MDSATQCLNNWALGEKRQSGGKFLLWGGVNHSWATTRLGLRGIHSFHCFMTVCENQHLIENKLQLNLISTTATLGTEESEHCKEVVVVERF